MLGHVRSWSPALLLACAAVLPPGTLSAAPVAVRHTEGLVHGFLVLRTLEGNILADGDLIQVAHGNRVTNHLMFRFRDGSVRDETAIFSQRGTFRLLNYHLMQKGPAFQRPMEVLVDSSTGQVRVRYTDEDAKEKVITDRLKLPPDVANGMIFHAAEERPTRWIADGSVDGGGHAKAAACEARGHSPRRGTVLDRRLQAKGHSLRHKGGDWGRRRGGGSAAWKTASRHPRVDSRRGGPGLCQIGGSALPGRPDLADRADESGLAASNVRGFQGQEMSPARPT